MPRTRVARFLIGIVVLSFATVPSGDRPAASPPPGARRLDPYLTRAADLALRLETPSTRARAERELASLGRIVGLDLASDPAAAIVRVGGHPEEAALARIHAGLLARERVTDLVRVPLVSLRALSALSGVRFVESTALLHPRLDIAVPMTGAAALHGRDPSIDGTGVVYGSIDTGIDVTHPTFHNPDGTTRVEAVWDVCDMSGPAPPGFARLGGTLYTRDDIDAMLGGDDRRFPRQDIDGHGTLTAAVGAGSGDAGLLEGMAPGAAIVVVAVPVLGGQQACGNPNLGLQGAVSALLTEAARFIEDTADGRPFVVNMSLGEHTGPHDGTSLLDRELEAIANAPGRALVAAAGNEGAGVDSTGRGRSVGWVHGGGVLPASGTPLALSATVPAPGPATVELWYPGDAEVELLVRQGKACGDAVPTGDELDRSAFYIDNARDGVDERNGEHVALVQVYSDLGAGGDAAECAAACGRYADVCGDDPLECEATCLSEWSASRVECIQTTDITGSRNPCRRLDRSCNVLRFTIEARTLGDQPVRIDAYAPDFMTVLDAEGSPMTIGEPASSRGVIATGALVHREGGGFGGAQGELGDLTTYSSRGPMRDGRTKPEIAAPAELITSAVAAGSMFEQISNDGWMTINGGTSSASPGVAGAIALLLEVDPTLDLPRLHEALALGAIVDDAVGGVPNDDWGWGKLQVEDALAALDPEREDADSDGFGAAAAGGLDCDDSDAEVGPRAAERPGNGIDDDCDGNVDEPLPVTGFHESDDPWCHSLEPEPDAGPATPDGGTEQGLDASTGEPDAALPTGGGVAGGACSCRAAGAPSGHDALAALLALGACAALARRRRRVVSVRRV